MRVCLAFDLIVVGRSDKENEQMYGKSDNDADVKQPS